MSISVAGTNLSEAQIVSLALQPDGTCLVIHSGGTGQQADFQSALRLAGELANDQKAAILILPQSVPGVRRMSPQGQQGERPSFLVSGGG